MFPDILKRLREENDLTQKDLADYLNVTDRNIRFYESGERMPPSDILIRLSKCFHVSVDYLLGLTDVKDPIHKTVPEQLANIEDLSSESLKDLKKYIELLKIKDMQDRNCKGDELTKSDWKRLLK